MKKIIITFFLLLGFLYVSSVDAAIVIPWGSEIEKVSLNVAWGGSIESNINIIGIELLRVVKRILMWIMVIFIVYTWAMMIMSMWSDEEQLSSAKRQIWYSIVALLFINIPESLYRVFVKDGGTTVGWEISTDTFGNESTNISWNLFVDWIQVWLTVNDSIIYFLEIMIFLWAIFMITLAGIQLMTWRGKEDKMKEAKNKIIYTILALIFVGIIEAWKRLAFGGEISDGVNLFESLVNLALFFAVPVAIFFLVLAAFYLITSNGDEERVKKAKSIIINTLLATLILLASYTFLLDLASF